MEENLFTPDCIRTFTGKYVNVFNPSPEMFCIEDIAHALSQQPRFGGHLKKFYSVAQHSCLCADLAQPEFKFDALMHDAAEAYLIDVPRPIKHKLANYKEIELNLMEKLSTVFGFRWPMPDNVKKVDDMMLNIEWNSLMLQRNEGFICLDSQSSEELFLRNFKYHKTT